jgi:hypothetical protein
VNGLIERHHDYVLGPNQDPRLASVAAGAAFSLSLYIDTDAPFALRSRAMRVSYTTVPSPRVQAYLNSLLLRWAGPDRNFFSQNLVRQSLLAPYFGQLGNPIPVYPQVVYPRGAEIRVDILNDGTNPLTNLTLYFRGVKLFAPGAVKSYMYPDNVGLLPFIYPQGRRNDADGSVLVRDVQVIQGPLRQTFQCKPDADFVLRAGQAGLPFSTTPVNEVFIRLLDEDEKPYSNDAVHMDVLFGNSAMPAMFYPYGAAGFTNVQPIGAGPNSPGLVYPEIYVPKNHLMYMDVSRDDSAYGGAVPINLPVQFIGMKVFQK